MLTNSKDMGGIMITWQLNELKERYEAMSGETLSYRQIAEGAKISKSTVWKIMNDQAKAADFAVTEALLRFFSEKLGQTLTLSDILRYQSEQST